jgi:hypothetical protein
VSASDHLAIEAQNFRYGFLSAGVHDVLGRGLGSALSKQEVAQLEDVEQFLSDVIAGVRLIDGGAPAAAVRHPMAALGRVLDPISAIEQFRSYGARELLALFDGIRALIHESAVAGKLSGNKEQLQLAMVVFGALTQSILSYFQRQARSSTDDFALTA